MYLVNNYLLANAISGTYHLILNLLVLYTEDFWFSLAARLCNHMHVGMSHIESAMQVNYQYFLQLIFFTL